MKWLNQDFIKEGKKWFLEIARECIENEYIYKINKSKIFRAES